MAWIYLLKYQIECLAYPSSPITKPTLMKLMRASVTHEIEDDIMGITDELAEFHPQEFFP
jgi:hypothetical protein